MTLIPDLSRNDLIVCIVTGVLLALCFPPFGFSLLIFVALAPMLYRLEPKAHRHNAQMGFWTGLVYYSLLLYWLVNVTLPGLIMLIIVVSALFALAAVVIGLFKSPGKRVFAAASVFLVIEILRAIGPFAFAWGFFGHALYPFESLIQITYYIGVFGLSFFIVAVNQTLAELAKILWHCYSHKCRRIILDSDAGVVYSLTGFLVLAWLGNYGYGLRTVEAVHSQYSGSQKVRVGLVQPNIPLWEREESSASEILAKSLTLSEAVAKQNPQLIIWPESTIASPLNYWPTYVKDLQSFVENSNTKLLFGTVYGKHYQDDTWDFWNRAFLFSPGDEYPINRNEVDLSSAPSYDKMHLVPYGEWVPLGNVWPMNMIETLIEQAGAGIFERGQEQTIFSLTEDVQFAVAICYESSLSGLLNRARDNGADFLVNITNDAWFKQSPGLMQHFILSIFRAAENRLPVVRVGNTGITGLIGPTGEVIMTLPDNKTDYRVVEFNVLTPETN